MVAQAVRLRLVCPLLDSSALGWAGPGSAWRGMARQGKTKQGKGLGTLGFERTLADLLIRSKDNED